VQKMSIGEYVLAALIGSIAAHFLTAAVGVERMGQGLWGGLPFTVVWTCFFLLFWFGFYFARRLWKKRSPSN
jgi:uncharacterized membrane protein YdjX (TVP38/TMEM64 family)